MYCFNIAIFRFACGPVHSQAAQPQLMLRPWSAARPRGRSLGVPQASSNETHGQKRQRVFCAACAASRSCSRRTPKSGCATGESGMAHAGWFDYYKGCRTKGLTSVVVEVGFPASLRGALPACLPAECRRVSLEDVQHVLHHGVLNWKLSKFGGKPSPVYVLEGPGAPASTSPGQEGAAPASTSAAAAVEQDTASCMPGSVPAGTGWLPFAAAVGEDAGLAAAHAAAGAGAGAKAATDAGAALAGQLARQLRVPFAANGGKSVALTIIDLQLDCDEA